jgi:hypothetical protein
VYNSETNLKHKFNLISLYFGQVGSSIFVVHVPVELDNPSKIFFYVFSKQDFAFLKRILVKQSRTAGDVIAACLDRDTVYSLYSSQW